MEKRKSVAKKDEKKQKERSMKKGRSN